MFLITGSSVVFCLVLFHVSIDLCKSGVLLADTHWRFCEGMSWWPSYAAVHLLCVLHVGRTKRRQDVSQQMVKVQTSIPTHCQSRANRPSDRPNDRPTDWLYGWGLADWLIEFFLTLLFVLQSWFRHYFGWNKRWNWVVSGGWMW